MTFPPFLAGTGTDAWTTMSEAIGYVVDLVEEDAVGIGSGHTKVASHSLLADA